MLTTTRHFSRVLLSAFECFQLSRCSPNPAPNLPLFPPDDLIVGGMATSAAVIVLPSHAFLDKSLTPAGAAYPALFCCVQALQPYCSMRVVPALQQ
jgi:hypothetical protein